jgi:hypothetical protein
MCLLFKDAFSKIGLKKKLANVKEEFAELSDTLLATPTEVYNEIHQPYNL